MSSKLVRAEKTLSGNRANFNFSMCQVILRVLTKTLRCQVKTSGAEQVSSNIGNPLGAEHQKKGV